MYECNRELSFQGVMALDSPYTGIVDWRLVSLTYGRDFQEAGGTVVTEYEASDMVMARESSPASTEGVLTYVDPGTL